MVIAHQVAQRTDQKYIHLFVGSIDHFKIEIDARQCRIFNVMRDERAVHRHFDLQWHVRIGEFHGGVRKFGLIFDPLDGGQPGVIIGDADQRRFIGLIIELQQFDAGCFSCHLVANQEKQEG